MFCFGYSFWIIAHWLGEQPALSRANTRTVYTHLCRLWNRLCIDAISIDYFKNPNSRTQSWLVCLLIREHDNWQAAPALGLPRYDVRLLPPGEGGLAWVRARSAGRFIPRPTRFFVKQLALMMQTLVTYWHTCETQLYTLGCDFKRFSSSRTPVWVVASTENSIRRHAWLAAQVCHYRGCGRPHSSAAWEWRT